MNREPSSTFSTNDWLLKLLSGPHRGAELLLAEGTYRLGSHDDCDLILQDAGLAPQHLSLAIRSTGPELVAHEEALLWCEAESWTERLAPQPFQIILIGHTFFALAPFDAQWPNLSLPDPNLIDTHPRFEQDEAEQERATEEPVTVATTSQTPCEDRGRRMKKSLVPLLLMLPLMLLLAFQWRLSAKQPSTTEVVSDPLIEKITLGLQAAKIERVDIYQDRGGRHWIRGYVPDDERRRALINRFRDQPEIILEITPISRLKEGVLQVLGSLNLDLTVNVTGGGGLMLEGWVWEEAQLWEALARIRRDVPGVSAINNQVSTRGHLLQFFQTALSQRGLMDHIHLSVHNGAIGIKGTLTPAQEIAWREIKQQFEHKFPDRVQLKESLTKKQIAKKKPAFRIPGLKLAINAVSVGKVRYVTLSDGTKVFEGTRLGSGHTLQTIESARLIFKYRGHSVVHRIGGIP